MWLRTTAGAALAALLALSGCSSKTETLEISGTVTLNDQPVGTGSDASIRFEPINNTALKPVDGIVNQGKYQVSIAPGSYRVAINWSKGTGKKARPNMKGPGSDAELTEQAIPDRYNTQTTLTAEVTPGALTHNFALTK